MQSFVCLISSKEKTGGNGWGMYMCEIVCVCASACVCFFTVCLLGVGGVGGEGGLVRHDFV